MASGVRSPTQDGVVSAREVASGLALLPTQQRCRSTAVSYRGLRSIGKTGGHDPALMTPSVSKPCRSYRGIFLALVLSR